ncbi:MAG: hypothetical protein LBH80_07035 [Prevotellaceae bacterium]|nr:hypothetical protein [Prevotellaceae bacterium]
MNIYELIRYIEEGTNLSLEVGWKWEKVSHGNECKTLIVKYKGCIGYWRTYKYRDPKKLRKSVYEWIAGL